MLGAAGALCCLAGGTALGSWMRVRRMERLSMLQAEMEALYTARLLLEQERPALPELLEASAAVVPCGGGAAAFAARLRSAAGRLRERPFETAGQAYAYACSKIAMPWEKNEEKTAMETLFAQIGAGPAAMREQAAAACIRRLKPLAEKAQQEAEKAGKLCVQLGMLLGLMAGIILW